MTTILFILLALCLIGAVLIPGRFTPVTGIFEDEIEYGNHDQARAAIPQTIASVATFLEAPVAMPLLSDFAADVLNNNPNQLVGVYAPGLFALPVVQQPDGNAAYVSTQTDTVTQFSMANRYNVIGLLAHNYLSGENFFKLDKGSFVILVYGDGNMDYYRVSNVESFQALNPNSPYSEFIDLLDPAETRLSSTQLFKRVYTTENHVVFQTCIKAFGDPSWGRLFITAEPVDEQQPVIIAASN